MIARTTGTGRKRIIYTIHQTPHGRKFSARLGDVLPCCDPSVSTISALLSSTCNWCTSADYTAQQQLLQNPNNAGNTSGVPCCDPNAGFFSSLFSNQCNLCNPVSSALSVGLGPIATQIPEWVWVGGIGVLAVVLLRLGVSR